MAEHQEHRYQHGRLLQKELPQGWALRIGTLVLVTVARNADRSRCLTSKSYCIEMEIRSCSRRAIWSSLAARQDDYVPWVRSFKLAAKSEGVWDFCRKPEAILKKPNREDRASSNLPSIYCHIVRQHKRERSGTYAIPACIQIQLFDCAGYGYRLELTHTHIYTYEWCPDLRPKDALSGNAIRSKKSKYIRNHPGFMYEGNRLVLDPHDNPVVNHKFIPLTLSAHTIGAKLQEMYLNPDSG